MLIRKPDSDREGTVTVVAAISMIAILSFVALSLDGGILMDQRRQIQSASDASARFMDRTFKMSDRGVYLHSAQEPW
jgi:Flp pilus assembly protein TadG